MLGPTYHAIAVRRRYLNRHPGESRDPSSDTSLVAEWIPAFAGMTKGDDEGVRAERRAADLPPRPAGQAPLDDRVDDVELTDQRRRWELQSGAIERSRLIFAGCGIIFDVISPVM